MVQANGGSFEDKVVVIDSILQNVLKSNDEKALNDGFGILHKLLTNIAKEPTNDKFYKFNSTNAKISSTVCSLKGASIVDMMKIVGYEETAEAGVFMWKYDKDNFATINRAINMLYEIYEPIRITFLPKEEGAKAKLLFDR